MSRVPLIHTHVRFSLALSQQEQRVAHERGTSASSFAIVRLHVTSGYPYASVVCMGPGSGPLSVYGRCVVLILLARVSNRLIAIRSRHATRASEGQRATLTRSLISHDGPLHAMEQRW